MFSRIRPFLMALCFTAAAATASAQSTPDIGIQFDKMPVGTQAYYQRSNGKDWTEVYIGKRKGLHVIKQYAGKSKRGRILVTKYFDSKGRMVYSTNSKGYKRTFKPYYCFYQFGKCTYKWRDVNGTANGEWQITTSKLDGGYLSTSLKDKTGRTGNSFWTVLGKYNLPTLKKWPGKDGRNTIKLVSIK